MTGAQERLSLLTFFPVLIEEKQWVWKSSEPGLGALVVGEFFRSQIAVVWLELPVFGISPGKRQHLFP